MDIQRQLRILAIASLFGIIVGLFAFRLEVQMPAFFKDQKPQSFNIIEKPFVIDSVSWQEIAPDKIVTLDGFRIHFHTEPETVQLNVSTKLLWSITDSEGIPVPLDTSIHEIPVHVYVVRSDLGSDLLHLHPRPTKEKPELWSDVVRFSSSGKWHIFMQFVREGKVYNFILPLFIKGQESESFIPDFLRERELDQWVVRLEGVAEKVYLGEPVLFKFVVESKFSQELNNSDLNGGHNVIFAHQNKLFIWNVHGDRSVEDVSDKVGIEVKRVPTNIKPFSYFVKFSQAGLWLIHFEINSQPARFFVNVEED